MKTTNELTLGKVLLYIMAFIAVIIGFSMTFGGYDHTHPDELIPLLRVLIPYLLLIGTPVILTLIILAIVKTTTTGIRLAKKGPDRPRNKTGRYVKRT
jgi:hypothetical protein